MAELCMHVLDCVCLCVLVCACCRQYDPRQGVSATFNVIDNVYGLSKNPDVVRPIYRLTH
jgi:hypothetical protein